MSGYKRSGKKTLLWSVLMSSPGPIVVGIGLFFGKSSTQTADFVRRSAELLAIIASFAVYTVTTREGFEDTAKKRRLERNTDFFVGAAMCVSGAAMLLLALLSSNQDAENVIPGLCIATLGVIANFIFWRRYSCLGSESENSILLVQSRLYRAKTLVDGCVTAALLSIALFPGSSASIFLDKAGSVIVSLYLLYTGLKTILERKNAQ